ncbi:nitroreductase family deazaflavin-dependent oxidoreductase [Yinghuangia soli]|uniref:Nitroreductase family deazaflavin-dependent oxidoreductase n=1 Tax=Yinghuangia soli TaxID=2908204 RepID=A0AA41Q9T6_9ACTN|nr:nitroreductase family deazaflavin-dependent oxidoreductase [Yinghuangia soli]MCF2533391.1 nitroreductase family deazaflavin-dependent oxidoreductase [Yinghuangia soli]
MDTSRNAEMKRFNEALIAEFRAAGGRLGGAFEGRQMLLLTTTGRRSGIPRTSPLAFSRDGDRYVVAASNRGADDHPSWFRNLTADPDAIIEIGGRTLPVRAAEITDRTERTRLYAAHKALVPSFGDYESATERTIPVVVLQPVGQAARSFLDELG